MKSYIQVIGPIWMPQTTGATIYNLTSYDIENIKNENEEITREDIDRWLCCHSGDFQYVKDFSAYIEDEDFPWEDEENEWIFQDLMYPSED